MITGIAIGAGGMLALVVTPLRFRAGPLGGPFRRGAASWAGVLAAGAVLYSMLSLHGAAGALRPSQNTE